MSEETLEGILIEIRYHEDGFLIGKINNGATVKGQMLWADVGMAYTFKGHWENHPKFGRGFKFDEYQASFPTSHKAIREYLEENVEGIGPKLAEKMTESFGDQTLSVLKDEPSKVADTIGGVTKEKAGAISDKLKEIEKRETLCLTLKEMVRGTRLSKSALNAIILKWREHAPEVLKNNPYELIEEIKRVGFAIADAIARKVGFDPEGYPRVRAGVIYTLRRASQESGHVFLPYQTLLERAAELMAVSEKLVASMVPRIAKGNPESIRIVDDKIYLIDLYDDEKSVAEKVRVMLAKT